MKTVGTWLLAALVGSMAVGCAAEAEDGSAGQSEAEVVVGVGDLSDKVAVYADRLEFDAEVFSKLQGAGLLGKVEAYARAADKKAAEPVYFAGNRQSDAIGADGALKENARNKSGYLRRALSWKKGDRGTVVVMTEAASISDALEELKKNGFINLDAGSKVAPLDGNGVDTDDGFGNTNQRWTHTFGTADGFKPIDLSGKELFRKDLLTGGSARLVLKRGKIDIKPTVDAQILVKRFIPQTGSAILTTDVAGEIEFEALSDGAFEIFHGDTLLHKSFGTKVANLPLTLGIDVKWDCGLGSTGKAVATLGATANGNLRAGAEFSGLSLKGILDRPTYAFTALGPAVDSNVNVNGVCHLITELKLQVFDSAGPEAVIDLYSTLAADGSQAQLGGQARATLKAGAETKVAGALRPFGFAITEIKMDPLKIEREVFNGAITFGTK